MHPRLFEIPYPVAALALLAGGAIAVIGLFCLCGSKRPAVHRVGGAALAVLGGIAAATIVSWDVARVRSSAPVHSFGAMLVLGTAAGIATAVSGSLRSGVARPLIAVVGLIIVVAGSGGAWLGHEVFYPHEHYREPGVVTALHGGRMLLGGMAVGIPLALAYARWGGASALATADAIAPGLAIGGAFGRVGCFLAGCCFGCRCDGAWPLAVRFPPFSPAAVHHRVRATEWSFPVHPIQLYSAATMVGILVAVHLYRSRWSRRSGEAFFLLLVLYALARFALEFVRDDSPRGATGLTVSQLLCGPTLAVGLGGIWLSRRMGPPLASRGARME